MIFDLEFQHQYLQKLILYIHEDGFLAASFSVLLRTESSTVFLVSCFVFFLDAIFHDRYLAPKLTPILISGFM